MTKPQRVAFVRHPALKDCSSSPKDGCVARLFSYSRGDVARPATMTDFKKPWSTIRKRAAHH